MRDIDDELRARFAALRAHDAAQAPELDAMRRRGESRATIRAGFPPRMSYAAAAAAIIVMAATMTFWWTREHRSTSTMTPPIAAWESPTSSLLPRADHALLAPPPLLSSVLDGVGTSALQRKGD